MRHAQRQVDERGDNGASAKATPSEDISERHAQKRGDKRREEGTEDAEPQRVLHLHIARRRNEVRKRRLDRKPRER